jgi:structural maintenance of chromosome 1
MRRGRKLRVRLFASFSVSGDYIVLLAVTLDGTIIHKSGLITGGNSTHSNKRFNEQDVQGKASFLSSIPLMIRSGLQRQRDSLLSQMRELSKQKPRAKNDDALMAEITKYESEIMIVQDELVSSISLS